MTASSATEAFIARLRVGKADEAEAVARKLLAQEEGAGRPESPETQRALDLLLEIWGYRSDRSTPEVDGIGRRALVLREKFQGPDSVGMSITLRLLAVAQVGRGQFSDARATVDRSVAIFERMEKSGHQFTRDEVVNYSRAVGVLAGVSNEMRDWNGAKKALLKSMELKDRISKGSPAYGASYMNLGRLEHQAGNHVEALAAFAKARPMLLLGTSPEEPLLAELSALEAYCTYETGRKAEGLALLEKALQAREKIHGGSDITVTSTADDLAALYRMEGRFGEAKPLIERSLAITRKGYGPLHPTVAQSEAHLSTVLVEIGDTRGALPHALEAERIARQHFEITIATLPEREATLFALKRLTAIPQAVTVAVELKGDTIGPVYDALIRSRSLVFDELASRHRVQSLSSEDSQLISKLSEDLRGARERLARLAFGAGYQPEPLQKALEERDSLDRKLAAASLQYRRRITGRSAGVLDVVSALPEATAMVSFVQFERIIKGTEKERTEYAAFVVTTGVPAAVVALGPAAEINNAVDQVRARLAAEAAAPGVAVKRNEAAYRAAAEKLRKLVWDPIDRYVASSKRIFIVPDGALHTVNFAALPEAGAEGKYLIERGVQFHYLSAERDVVTAKSLDPAGVGLLAVGNPSFNRPELARGKTPGANGEAIAGVAGGPVFRGARSNCSAMQTMQFADLPSSGREVEAISRLWRRGTNGEAIELTGELAGPERFKAMAPGRRTIHLAVHGFVAGTDCTDPIRNENPLLLTGLALAGANKRGSGVTGEDGILTAEEIASLDLRGVEWAVLSACDTGLGKATSAEGVFGLRRAFQLAGAHTVVMSLWPVEDKVTTDWMQFLYEQRLTRKSDTAGAVRAASLEMLKRRRAAGKGTHPFYWAPFVAVGDWR